MLGWETNEPNDGIAWTDADAAEHLLRLFSWMDAGCVRFLLADGVLEGDRGGLSCGDQAGGGGAVLDAGDAACGGLYLRGDGREVGPPAYADDQHHLLLGVRAG